MTLLTPENLVPNRYFGVAKSEGYPETRRQRRGSTNESDNNLMGSRKPHRATARPAKGGFSVRARQTQKCRVRPCEQSRRNTAKSGHILSSPSLRRIIEKGRRDIYRQGERKRGGAKGRIRTGKHVFVGRPISPENHSQFISAAGHQEPLLALKSGAVRRMK